MIRNSFLSLIALVLLTTPSFAAVLEPVKPSIYEGPNLALALVACVQLIAILSIAALLRRLTQNTDYFVKLRKMRDASKAGNAALILGAILASTSLSAQAADAPAFPDIFRNENTMMLLGLNILLLIVFIYLTTLLKRTIAMLLPEVAAEAVDEIKIDPAQSTIMAALTDAVPLDREYEVLLDHEYDGIRELDNNLPPWWVWMFYTTIIIGIVYMVWYHVLPFGENQQEEYIAEVQQAEEDRLAYIAILGESVDESSVTFLESPEDLTAGKAIYIANCQACHAADGGGGVGPNFTDSYWLHGGSITDMFKTIKYGVPQKGMISWESQLRPKEMAQVASYIKTLRGNTAANPKEPQGELYSESVSDSVSPAATDTTKQIQSTDSTSTIGDQPREDIIITE